MWARRTLQVRALLNRGHQADEAMAMPESDDNDLGNIDPELLASVAPKLPVDWMIIGAVTLIAVLCGVALYIIYT